jgi:hypothetical protein
LWTRFFRDRCNHIIYQIEHTRREDKPEREIPLLALPTHQGGWLDPLALVQRMTAYQKAKQGDWGLYSINDLDFAQALLRLTPDGREEALRASSQLGEHRQAARLRFALGGPPQPDSVGGLHGDALQMAAAHARAAIDPSGNSGLPCGLPRACLRDDGSVHAEGPITDDLAIPSDLLMRAHSWHAAVPQQESWGNSAGSHDWLMEWQSLVWPFDRRPLLIWGALQRRVSPAVLKNLLDRDTTWDDAAARLAAWATGSESAEAKVLVTDALIEGFGACLIDPRLLGRHLAAIAGQLKLNRMAAVLAEAARVSELHQWAVLQTLDAFLVHVNTIPRELHHLLTPLIECATLTGQTLSEGAVLRLKSLTGASKTAKLASQLLGLKAKPAGMNSVRHQALEACLSRGERWAALLAG